MKYIHDFTISNKDSIGNDFALFTLSRCDGEKLPLITPGQFIQIKIPNSENTFLRRPISVCNVSDDNNELTILVRRAGEGTAALLEMNPGDHLNIIYPLGNGFPDLTIGKSPVLIGGGVGIAPLLFLAKELHRNGIHPTILIGARTKNALLLVDELSKYGTVHISTDDGSLGEKGVVTRHPVFSMESISPETDIVYCCGPAPMMKAVAKVSRHHNIPCFVSLENMMACGVGACLCCVENTVKGNVCVCTEGPVFNTNQLNWN